MLSNSFISNSHCIMCRKRDFLPKKKERNMERKGRRGMEGGGEEKARKEGRHVNIVDLSSINSSTLYFFLSFTLK